MGNWNPLRVYVAEKKLREALQSSQRVLSISEGLATTPAVLLCSDRDPTKISSVGGAVAPLSAQPVSTKRFHLQIAHRIKKTGPPYYAVRIVYSSHHAFQLVPGPKFTTAL